MQTSNNRVIRLSKLINEINIIRKDYIKEQFSSNLNLQEDKKKENLEPFTVTLMITNTSRDNFNNFEKTYVE